MNAPEKIHLPDVQASPDQRRLPSQQVGVRNIALRLQGEQRIGQWRVRSENFESIHNHSAYAVIEGSNRS